MKRVVYRVWLIACGGGGRRAGAPAGRAAESAGDQPWQKIYTGQEATGENVIGLWQFQPGQETKDASGHGHELKIQGEARFLTEGPLGGCLESFLGGEKNDKPQGAAAKNHPSLSPAGAFTLELWFKAKPELEQTASVFVVDKKYITYTRDTPEANGDYCLVLLKAGDPAASYLWQKLTHTASEGKGMPRTMFGAKKLPQEQLDVVERWIREGAKP